MENNQMAIFEGARDYVGDIMSRNEMYCSMVASTPEDKVKLFNATNNPAHRLADHINEIIEIKDLFLESVTVTNTDEKTGEVTTDILPRVVIIDPKGEGYQCVSFGIYNSLKKLISIFGEPNAWEKPIKVKIKQVTKADRKALTFELVSK